MDKITFTPVIVISLATLAVLIYGLWVNFSTIFQKTKDVKNPTSVIPLTRNRQTRSGGNFFEVTAMRKVITIAIVIIVTMFGGKFAYADRYFTGDLFSNRPSSSIDSGQRICADLSQFSNNSRVYFNLNTCNQMYRVGFTGDNRIVLSAQDNGRDVYIVSNSPALGFRNEVEHRDLQNTSNDTNQLVAAMTQHTMQADQNAVVANTYRESQINKISSKKNLGEKIALVGTVGQMVNLLNGKKTKESRLLQGQIWETGTGLTKALTGTDDTALLLKAQMAALKGDCLESGGCQ